MELRLLLIATIYAQLLLAQDFNDSTARQALFIKAVITDSPKPSETPGPEQIDGVIGGFGLPNRRLRDIQEKSKNKNDNTMLFIILGVTGGVLLAAAIIIAVLFTVLRKKKKGSEREKRVLLAKKPRKMEAEDLNRVKFNVAGPLIMDKGLHGPVRHALEDENSEAIQGVQFDAHQNEIVEIGTNVELINEINNTHASEAALDQKQNKRRKAGNSLKETKSKSP